MAHFFFHSLFMILIISACSSQQARPTSLPPTNVSETAISQIPENLISVLTNRYNVERTGANLEEVILNHANVTPDQFGKLFTREVEGHIYAQPLYVPNVEIPDQGTHNVVYIATMSNNVYAFDADDPELAEPLWEVNLGAPFVQDIMADIPGGEDGILSTPVIDPETATIYLVTRNQEDQRVIHKLHALDISTGVPRPNSPVEIELTTPGMGVNNRNGEVYLDSTVQLQRAGLLLLDGRVYLGFGAHCCVWWFGWVAAYDAATLELMSIFNTTPNGYSGGIWMAGSGLASDGHDIFLAAGNGSFTADAGGTEYANSVLKLTYASDGLHVADWFTPSNWKELDANNQDMGSGGTVIISDHNIVVVGAKDSNLYLVDSNDFGKFNPETNANLQTLSVGNGRIFATSVYWGSGPGGQPTIYAWAESDAIKAFSLNTESRSLGVDPASQSPIRAAGMPIGSMVLSANGTLADTGILWVLVAPYSDRSDPSGVLVAFDATDLNHLLWSSDINPERDSVGLLAKFNPATVANGKVYVATFSNSLDVYGLLDTSKE